MGPSTSPPLRRDDRTIVGRLRVRTAGAVDSAAARLRLEGTLGGGAFRPAGLPASAILCIRSLRDPMPGALSLDWRSRPPARWEQAMERELERAARGAARPIDGPVPAGQAAVLFRDRAEFLACLALDWIRGEIEARWWWRHLLRSGAGGDRIAPTQWIEDAPYVPAAARALADRGAVVPFAAKLEPEEAAVLVGGLYQAFGLERSSPATLSRPGSRQPIPGRTPAARLRWAPEADAPEIGRGPARAFVAVSLVLARAPSAARLPELHAAVERWMETSEGSPPPPRPVERWTETSEGSPPPPRPDEGLRGDAEVPGSSPAIRAAQPGVVESESGQSQTQSPTSPAPRAESARTPGTPPRSPPPDEPLTPPAPDRSGRTGGPLARPGAPSRTSPPSLDATGPRALPEHPAPHGSPSVVPSPPQDPAPTDLAEAVRVREGAIGPDDREETPPTGVSRDATPAADAPPLGAGSVISTAHGGVFFLLNVFLALELYGDFTRPRSRALRASPWALMTRVGRELVGDIGASFDSIWSLLADLAGPSDDPEAWPGEWRVQPEWLLPFPDRSGWTWWTSAGRLRVQHPAGFLVLDSPLEEDPVGQRAREWDRYGVSGAAEARGPLEAPPWPVLLADFVRARLHAALRAETPAASAKLALRIRARVRATDAHVDVHMGLAELPIEVRLAGLDRDPGWVPAAGRFVAFHFE